MEVEKEKKRKKKTQETKKGKKKKKREREKKKHTHINNKNPKGTRERQLYYFSSTSPLVLIDKLKHKTFMSVVRRQTLKRDIGTQGKDERQIILFREIFEKYKIKYTQIF